MPDALPSDERGDRVTLDNEDGGWIRFMVRLAH